MLVRPKSEAGPHLLFKEQSLFSARLQQVPGLAKLDLGLQAEAACAPYTHISNACELEEFYNA